MYFLTAFYLLLFLSVTTLMKIHIHSSAFFSTICSYSSGLDHLTRFSSLSNKHFHFLSFTFSNRSFAGRLKENICRTDRVFRINKNPYIKIISCFPLFVITNNCQSSTHLCIHFHGRLFFYYYFYCHRSNQIHFMLQLFISYFSPMRLAISMLALEQLFIPRQTYMSVECRVAHGKSKRFYSLTAD